MIFAYGEERRSRRIARAICLARAQKPIATTLELAALIEKTIGRKPGGIHPATRSFQALRIAVNREMDELVKGLFAAERLLDQGGRLAVVSFHSLEDRIVKRFFDDGKSATRVSRHMPRGQEVISRWLNVSRALKPEIEEINANPRARSAVLRFGRRSGEAAQTAAEAMKMTAEDLSKLGIVDELVPEPVGGAHRHPEETIRDMGDCLEKMLQDLLCLGRDELVTQRREKFLEMGRKGLT